MHGSPSILPLRLERLAFAAGNLTLLEGSHGENGPPTISALSDRLESWIHVLSAQTDAGRVGRAPLREMIAESGELMPHDVPRHNLPPNGVQPDDLPQDISVALMQNEFQPQDEFRSRLETRVWLLVRRLERQLALVSRF